MKKFFFSLLFVLILASPGWAEVIIDSYPESNYSGALIQILPGNDGGQSFTGNGTKINSIKLYAQKHGSPTGVANVVLYAHAGTYGTSSLPTGAIIATSDNVSLSSLSTDLALVTFSFSGANKIRLTNGTYYVFRVVSNDTDLDNYFVIGIDTTSPTHSGNQVYWETNEPSAIPVYDTIFYAIDDPNIYYVDSSITDTHVASATPDFTTYNPVTFATDTGTASVFKTIADINASSFSAGDSILFRKGQQWREQLTVPSSGSSTVLPITFGAYGSGVNPIITGSDLKNSGYTQYSSTVTGTVTQGNMRLSTVDGTAFVDFNNSDSAALSGNINAYITLSDSTGGAGHRIKGYIKAVGTGTTVNLSGTEKLPNTDFANTTGITYSNATVASVGGGQSGNCLEVTSTASPGIGQEVISTVTVGALYAGSAYLKKGTGISISFGLQEQAAPYTAYNTTGYFAAPADWTKYTLYATPIDVNIKQVYGVWQNASTHLFDTVSLQQVISPSQYGVTITTTAGGSTYNWDVSDGGSFNYNDTSGYSYSIAAASTTIWQADLTTEPKVVYFDGVLGTLVANAAAVNGAGKWFWAANVLYVYSTSDPATAFTNPGIEVGARNSAIHTNTKSYITIDGLTLRDGNNVNDSVVHVGSASVVGFVIQNSTVERGRGTGINLIGSTTATSATINNCTIQNNGAYGVLVDYTYTTATVSNSTFTGNGWAAIIDSLPYGDLTSILGNFIIFGNNFSNVAPNGDPTGDSGNYCHSIYSAPTSTAFTAYNNVFHDNRYGDAIKTQSSATIYNNLMYGNSGSAVEVASNGAYNISVLIYDNVAYLNCTNNNQGTIEESNKGAGTLSITAYNNTFYKNGTYAEINIQNDITALVLKNNAIYSNTGAYGYRSPTQSAATINNNLVYGPSGSPVYYNGGARTWATWQGYGFDTAGVNADPLFLNAAGGDFRLSAGSPAINAGVDVGLLTDYRDRPVALGHVGIGAYQPASSMFRIGGIWINTYSP